MPSKKRRLRVGLLIALNCAVLLSFPIPQWARAALSPQPNPHASQVLFVGNSFTFGGNLPTLIEQITRDTQHPIASELIAPGGVTLGFHFRSKATLAAIVSKKWDYIVLQNCSNCPLRNRELFQSDVKTIVNIVRESGAKPVLYMTWADLHKQDDINVISEAYETIGRELSVPVVPVGKAWAKAVAESDGASLFEADQHHASPTGALLSAYTFLHFFNENTAPSVAPRPPPVPNYFYQLILPAPGPYPSQNILEQLYKIAAQVTHAGAEKI